MTRKDAIQEAISIIEKSKIGKQRKAEILEKLNLCIDELPFATWSRAAIFDACDQYIKDTGRNLTVTDFNRKSLPAHTTIQNRFGMSAAEFRDTYYPLRRPGSTSPYSGYTVAEWNTAFTAEFNRIKPSSAVDFNRRRVRTVPSWVTVARMNGLSNWKALLKKLHLTPFPKGHVELEVESHFPTTNLHDQK